MPWLHSFPLLFSQIHSHYPPTLLHSHSLFQVLGSWGRAKKSEREKRKGRTKERKRREFLALVLPPFSSLSLSLFFARPQPPRTWNRLALNLLSREMRDPGTRLASTLIDSRQLLFTTFAFASCKDTQCRIKYKNK